MKARIAMVALGIMLTTTGCGSAARLESSPTAVTAAPRPAERPLAPTTTVGSAVDTVEHVPAGFDQMPTITTPSPDLGQFSDVDGLVTALQAYGPLDNEEPVAIAQGVAPNLSICASIVTYNEPSAGTVVFQGVANLLDQTGVVLVLRGPDGAFEARLYGVHDADPVTGGCPLLASAPIG